MVGNTEAYKCVTGNVIEACYHLHNLSTSNCPDWLLSTCCIVAVKVGYSSEEFGLLISLEQTRMEELEVKETPEEVASRFTCAMFENPPAILRGARHMAIVEISVVTAPYLRRQ
ncbi:hypothetical protein L2E82_13622 [Cichorium intybus]|uniref:Uncharacterized protein n=1 Tax=Cichorium intybus TaxID=13427 RepID=A0ACB9EYZ8_CICIN|nr:hypothetical protein L2E82_13622 [Cichorium intybus]